MNSGMNRWLVSGTWLFAVIALISASTKGAIGVGAMWSVPAAIGVTMAAMGWPDKPASRVLAALGVVWQVALIGAYWPFTSAEADPANVTGPMRWSVHSIVILVVLMVLAMSFVALYVLPALGLMGRIKRAARVLAGKPADALDQVALVFDKDPGLQGLWQEYLGQLRPANDANASADTEADPNAAVSSCASARDLFDPGTVSHTRLRLEFFRNLPGVFTGIGIIGTFSGLISGLRAFQISQDPTVVQRSLESLLTGVWGAFLISALAIAMAIVVTVIEKLVSSALSHNLEMFAAGLDGLYPPRPQSEADGWVPQLLAALTALGQRGPVQHASANAATQAATFDAAADGDPREQAEPGLTPMHAAMVPMSMEAGQQGADVNSHLGGFASNPALRANAPGQTRSSAAVVSPELATHMLDMAQSTRAATLALGEMASRMPDLLSSTLQGANQNHLQASQAMKTLASRLEGVASGIEFSARKTLETVASRLMQSEMNMVSRHHAVADHLGELVQRIEALCGLLQQDRADINRSSEAYGYGGDDGAQGGAYGPGFGGHNEAASYRGAQGSRRFPPSPNPYAAQQREHGPQAQGHPNGYGNNGQGNGYDGPQDPDAWQEQPQDMGGFGR
jgi:MotA/TolQ/ExbB proton channel family